MTTFRMNPFSYKITEPTIIILRGVSGSGKSYYANKLKSLIQNYKTEVVYPYETQKLKDINSEVIIIDDTNISISKIEPYINLAKEKSYQVFVIDINTPWSLNVKECLKKSSYKNINIITEQINEMKQTISEPPKYEEDEDAPVVLRFGDKMKKLYNKIKYMTAYY
jgi:predicted kinase